MLFDLFMGLSRGNSCVSGVRSELRGVGILMVTDLNPKSIGKLQDLVLYCTVHYKRSTTIPLYFGTRLAAFRC